MRGSLISACISVFSIIAGLGCENEILLTPTSIVSDDSSGYPSSNLYDTGAGSPTSYWKGAYYEERIKYYFSAAICVTEMYVHTYGTELDYLYAYVGSTDVGRLRSVGSNDAVSFKVANWCSIAAGFYFRTTSTSILPQVSIAWVYGCYMTSTHFPSTHPTTSPTMPPVTRLPTKAPSLVPTTAPTMPPTTEEPTSNPSLYPSVSPTVSPTPLSAETSSFTPTNSPTLTPTTAKPTYYPSLYPSLSPVSPTTLSAEPSMSPTVSPTTLPTFSPTPLSAEPSLLPTERHTSFEDGDDSSFLQGKSSLFVGGGVVFIFCVGLSCLLWLIKRQRRRQEQVISLLNEKIAMVNIQIAQRFEGELYPREGQVRNATRGDIQLASIRSISPSDEAVLSDL